MWSHVIDRQCKLLHDKVGNASVTQSNPVIVDKAIGLQALWSGDGEEAPQTNGDSPFRPDWWTRLLYESKAWPIQEDIVVKCTSAGETTRLDVSLSGNSPANTGVSRDPNRTGASTTDSGEVSLRMGKHAFVTTHNGAVISVAQGNVHLRISLEEGASVTARTAGHGVESRKEVHHHTSDAISSLVVRILLNRGIDATIPLQTLSNEGALVQLLDGAEGTQVLELCLMEGHRASGAPDSFGHSTGEQPCLAQGDLIFEMFPRDTYILQRRRVSSMYHGRFI